VGVGWVFFLGGGVGFVGGLVFFGVGGWGVWGGGGGGGGGAYWFAHVRFRI